MKSARVYRKGNDDIEVKIVQMPVPTPEKNQVLVKVVVAGSNPKDWKYPFIDPKASGTNTGDDVAGYVEAVGPDVTEFQTGQRVAAFHQPHTSHGAYGEYAIAGENYTFHLPEHVSFEEGVTIPLTATTAAVGLFAYLGLPEPWLTTKEFQQRKPKGGVLVYGASTAVGAFAIKLLRRADIHPIVGVAGKGIDYARSLLDPSKGDFVADYRDGSDRLVQTIKNGLPKTEPLMYAFDTVSENGTYQNVVKVLDPKAHISLILPGQEYKEVPSTMFKTITTGSSVFGFPDDLVDFGFVWTRWFGAGLKEGWLTGHPYEVIPGGLAGVDEGLRRLKEGRASAVKYVYRIQETKD
ncbi:uncharacterized protein Z519_04167 [Cladophialophora bantiana CBS 173.52]|uniref:Enoyl reductase (ER) domain-containing protein n=1 Tax=Cladophialophora bantiana (strain ATCC 10958 / CBS 173.52 / CDC B-1940 / NIH 8579) TaxID=1442370 RepID=A0A0D2GAH5_CLAB1|nr:uncharacterized protein Z519_04167 [Cladophialophora bantiana CBS 173.52]KIW95582.1 hypothetical protein Z519_04167 [Cladophialophora bantiana CBS 173.52]